MDSHLHRLPSTMADVIFAFPSRFHDLWEPHNDSLHLPLRPVNPSSWMGSLDLRVHLWPQVQNILQFFFFLCSPQIIWHHIRGKNGSLHGCCRRQSNLCVKTKISEGYWRQHRSRTSEQVWGIEREVPLTTLSQDWDSSPFLKQFIDHLLY